MPNTSATKRSRLVLARKSETPLYYGCTMARDKDFVVNQIERARRDGATSLDLTGASLEALPEEVFELTKLEVLYLVKNRISVVPDKLRTLSRLKRIDLRANPIEQVPDVPGLLLDWDAYLRCGALLSNQNVIGLDAVRPAGSADVIERLGHLTDLEYLGCSGFSTFPLEVRKLRRLRALWILSGTLDFLPEWLEELSRLATLAVDGNRLSTLPASLERLPLHTLFMGRNAFTEIPKVVFELRSLYHLDIHANPLRRIPPQILDVPNLIVLAAHNCPIETPPPEIVEQGVDAIKKYWRQQQEQGSDYLCEAKLLIVGEAGAGKTSLVQKIRDAEYQLKPAQASTEGIEVTPYTFPAAVRIKDGPIEKTIQRDFRTNIWDFGGQEIYHATHQFFLTKRSLYALVTDDRKEDTDFHYWLNVVELLSGGSPVIVVQNEKQDRRRDIDLGSLRSRFSNLREAYRVDLATNRGLKDLVRAIRHELEGLPHIGAPLPSTWNKVREALEKESRSHITLEEYLQICDRAGFKRRDDSLQLSGYLHDLGICLHFQDDAVLHNTVILKPKWGTDAAYRVLDDRDVMDNQGRFTPVDLARIWSEESYSDMRHELLRLLMRFQLCYELPHGGAYIAPQLLSSQAPPYIWNRSHNLVLRYEYDFMPKGLVTRLIAALHHLIEEHRLVWKTGMVLAWEGMRAEIVEDYARRRITVRVTGAEPRSLLAIIDNQMDVIHASFSKLRFEKHLPCNCAECRVSDDPATFTLRDLERFAEKGKPIQCRTSGEMVEPKALLATVFPFFRRAQEDPLHFNSVPEAPNEVFVSYAWTPESTAIVDRLETVMKANGIHLRRDRNELRYKDGIREFMKDIGRANCIVAVISKRYLESKYCMFELAEVAARGDLKGRIFPLILDDANIYDGQGRLQYIKHWETNKKKLDKAMKGVGAENLQGIREEIDDIARYRATIAAIVDTLANMNARPGAEFEKLIEAVLSRAGE